MKIKKFLIPGFIFTIIGLIGLLVIFAYNRFDIKKIELETLDIDMDVTTLDANIKIIKEVNLKYTTSNINIKLIDGKENYNFNASGKEKAFNYEGTTSNIEIN